MKIVVTGCAGFIGANFTEYILNNHPDDTVIGIDCLTYAACLPALSNLKKRSNFVFYKINICDRAALSDIFLRERPDAVINFAAESHVDRSIENSGVFTETNILGTDTLLDLSLKYGVARFHQVSTDEVYGDLPLDSCDSFIEQSPLAPSSPYSASKASADLMTLAYHRTHGISVTVSRSSNNYGRFQHPEKLIPKVICLALKNQPIPIYGNGLNIREWVNVLDHCRAIDLIVRRGRSGEIYNVGGGDLISNVSLTRQLLQLLDRPETLITYTADRKGHDRKYALCCDKLKAELGWQPIVPFEDGLRDTVLHYTKGYQ